MDSLQISKLEAIAVTLVLTFLFGLSPIKVRKFISQNPKIPPRMTRIGLSACLCFGAGVLFATILLHIIPENQMKMKALMNEGIISVKDYPLSELITCLGFLFIYLVEELVHQFFGGHHNIAVEVDKTHCSNSVANGKCLEIAPNPDSKPQSTTYQSSNSHSENDSRKDDCQIPLEHDEVCLDFTEKNKDGAAATEVTELASQRETLVVQDGTNEMKDNNKAKLNDVNSEDRDLVSQCETLIVQDKCHSHHHLPNHTLPSTTDLNVNPGKNATDKVSLIRSVTVILALSFHSTFEGLALGLGRTTYGIWLFCLAINSHKVFIAFSVGMELLEINIKQKLYILNMSIFALATPVGALISTFLYGAFNKENPAGLIAMVVLDGISAGTILFVVFCEVLERERAKTEGQMAKFIALVCGFAIIAATQAIKEPQL